MTRKDYILIAEAHKQPVIHHPRRSFYVEHTDTDANIIRFYGPFSKETAEVKVKHLQQVGHQAKVITSRRRRAR